MTREEIIELIDFSKLSKDYLNDPIKKISYHKYNYLPSEEDLKYLYLELNLTVLDISIFLNISKAMTRGLILKFKLEKSLNLKTLSIKKKKLEKYGDPNYNNIVKNKKTKLEHFGDPNYNNREKAKQTGYDKSLWLKKTKQTKLEHFGDPNYNNREKAKKTNLEKFGAESAMQNIVVSKKLSETLKKNFQNIDWVKQNLEKRRKTCLEKYGYSHQSKVPEIKIQKKIKSQQTILSKHNSYKEFYKSNLEKKYKTSYNEAEKLRQKKIYQTKKQNNSFNKSTPEKELLQLLLQKFPDTISQYRSDVYPFNCDFYIPSKDLYIEYQGSWTHGYKPFVKDNKECQEQLKSWKDKAIQKEKETGKRSFYSMAIYVWSNLDTRKREIAKENNLNYLEFFNKEEFMNWFNQQESK